MIGIFDSGVGGLVSYREVRRLLPREDIIYLADRNNAPYGTKNKDELIRLVKSDLRRLRDIGASKILVACCTASTVCPFLSREEQKDVITLIKPTADFIEKNEKYRKEPTRVTVIATEHTVSSRAFSKEILTRMPNTQVIEIAAQKLVRLVEEGASDGNIFGEAEEYLDSLSEKIADSKPKYLVLGCTHFSHLEKELTRRLCSVITVNPAKLGALSIAELLKNKKSDGSARSLYTE